VPWLALLVLLAAVLAGCAQAPHGDGDAQGRAWDWLLAQRDADGRWPANLVPYVVEAAVATGKDPATWPAPVPLQAQLAWSPDSVGYLASLRPLHAWALLPSHGGHGDDIRQRILAGHDGHQFGNPALLNDDAFAVMTLALVDRPAAASRTDALLENQTAAGGWSWAPGGEPETDMTGIVLSALSDAGVSGFDAAAARAFLDGTHAAGGGHALHTDGDANCDSTVWALRAYDILGGGPPADDGGFLASLQRGDGAFAYRPGGPGNALCTVEALPLAPVVSP
jgi:hypothetical protein